MIISSKQIQNILKSYGKQTKVATSAKTEGASPVQQKDEVILSSKAQEFAQVLQAAKNMPLVRTDKVEEFSESITKGTYQVDSQDIAEKMMESMQADSLR